MAAVAATTIEVAGVGVEFPFTPYECQRAYMEKVVQALEGGQNALLESPTGTGKTLCLLCSALAWRESRGCPRPTVVFASRTHSQLSQVLKELQRSSYGRRTRACVLGSRAQMCSNFQVLSAGKAPGTLSRACARLCASGGCPYRTRLNAQQQQQQQQQSEQENGDGRGASYCLPLPFASDAEDLVKYAKNAGVCPYYWARETMRDADLVLVPYNYLVDRRSRESLCAQGLTGASMSVLDGSIVIFDEAHNLDSSCTEAVSFDLKSDAFGNCVRELGVCVSKAGRYPNPSGEGGPSPELLVKLKERISAVSSKLGTVATATGVSFRGGWLRDVLQSEADITQENSREVGDLIDAAMEILGGDGNDSAQPIGLEALSTMLRAVFDHSIEDANRFFKAHIKMDESRTGWSLGYWCFSAALSIASLQSRHRVRSLILTSGTLAPLETLAADLGLEFQVTLENPHVVPKEHVWAGVITRSPSMKALNASFKTRDDPQYIAGLGQCLVNLARIVPAGLLVFFPSYGMLSTCMEIWKRPSSFWSMIEKQKAIFVEPKFTSQLKSVIEDYNAMINDKSRNGAVFMAVARGKVSEGLDFSDDHARAVVVTGLPYPNVSDPHVSLKREYMDEQAKLSKSAVNGNKWYSQQAMRAVNQSVGRVIRHVGDYGAILLCDERFAAEGTQNLLSAWLRPSLKVYQNFGEATRSLVMFFKERRAPNQPAQPAAVDVAVAQPPPLPAPIPAKPYPCPRSAPSPVVQSTGSKPSSLQLLAPPRRTSSAKGPPKQPAATAPTATPRHSGDDLISRLKSRMNAKEYEEFRGLLKDVQRVASTNMPAIFENIKGIFERNDVTDLWPEFVDFMPRALRKLYQAKDSSASTNSNSSPMSKRAKFNRTSPPPPP